MKLALGQLVILAVLIIAGSWSFNTYFKQATDRSEQIIGWNLAEHIAVSLRENLKAGKNYAELQQVFRNLVALGPKIEIYILDAEGRIVADSGGSDKIAEVYVPLAPIIHFLQTKYSDSAPIYNLNPRDRSEPSVFSAARVLLSRANYYVYAIFMAMIGRVLTNLIDNAIRYTPTAI